MTTEYFITGNTWPIKEDLKLHACKWAPEKKAWRTLPLEKTEATFLFLKELEQTHDIEMLPVNLNDEAKLIQDILKN